jgi:orotate phosphoribosyltransferase
MYPQTSKTPDMIEQFHKKLPFIGKTYIGTAMNTNSASIAKLLLQSQAVTLNVAEPYTYSSGIRSPIYCDNRILITGLESRKQIVDAFCEKVQTYKPKQIAGVATAGITWGAWIAEKLQLPFIYVRPKPKGHGKEKQIEGNFIREKTILIEDLISTGGSSIQALDALRAEKVPTDTLLAIFTYGFESAKKIIRRKRHRSSIAHRSGYIAQRSCCWKICK